MFYDVHMWSPFHNVPMDGSFTLHPGQSIFSPNKKQELIMQKKGNLVCYKLNDEGYQGEVLWASNTDDHPGAYAWFQRDANLVVYTPDGTARWAARDLVKSPLALNPDEDRFDYVGVGSYFALPDEGKMYIAVVSTLDYVKDSPWKRFVFTYIGGYNGETFDTEDVDFAYYKVPMDGSFTLRPGESIYSPNKKQKLIMQREGNLVQYTLNEDGTQGEVFWASNTAGNDGAYAAFQGDGNLVVYSPSGKVLYGVQRGNIGYHRDFEGVAGQGSSFALPDVGAMFIIHRDGRRIYFFL
jgi:hypothetical protein